MNKTLFIDTETTGLSRCGGDDLVEVSVVDDDGIVLLSTLVNPGRKIPAVACNIHGITDEMVAGSPRAEDVRKTVAEIIRDRDVVIYNASFDRQFLDLAGARTVACCMLRYAEHAGEWNAYFGNFRWHRLSAAAGETGFVWPKSGAHRAEADARACRHVWRWLDQHETATAE
jgi:DNA polymerase-3 subunit epsilon